VEGTGVTAPEGFRAAGVAAGLKGQGLLDLGLLVSDRPTASAIVDTPSALPSAAVIYTRSLHAGGLRGVVVNSGCANAATGEQGVVDARAMGETAAAAAGVPIGSLAVCSTGVIGERLPMKLLTAGMDAAAAALTPDGGVDFGEAIRTTDLFAKGGTFRLALSSGEVTIGADDVVITETPREGWAVASEGGESIALDLTITEELKRAGLARAGFPALLQISRSRSLRRRRHRHQR
jgi:glutamate N-acetyltransferase/amino-acid N-acetyltransferase